MHDLNRAEKSNREVLVGDSKMQDGYAIREPSHSGDRVAGQILLVLYHALVRYHGLRRSQYTQVRTEVTLIYNRWI